MLLGGRIPSWAGRFPLKMSMCYGSLINLISNPDVGWDTDVLVILVDVGRDT